MNAPLAVLPPAPQPAATPAPAQDAAAPDVPFSQVLSGEMAQQRRAEANADAAAPPADGATATDAETRTASGPAAEAGSAQDARSEEGMDAAEAAALAGLPDAMLALALHPELMKPASVPAVAATDTATADAGTDAYALSGIASPRAANAAALHQSPAEAGTGGQRPDPGLLRPQTDATRKGSASTEEIAAIADAAARQLPEAALGVERAPSFANAIALAQATQSVAAATVVQDTAGRLAPPVGTAAWNQALGERIVWMAAGSQQSAALTLNPPDLGPMQVVLNVTNDQASASFFAAQPEVRQALEAALPRLREMMQDAGIQLGQATVSADTPRQQDAQGRAPQRAATPFPGGDGGGAVEAAVTLTQPLRGGRGLVDTFA